MQTRVCLPPASGARERKGQRSMSKRVLLVGDDPVLYPQLRRILAARSYQVETVPGATEALERVASFPPTLVLADLALRDMTGVELGRRVRQTPPGPFLPFFLLLPPGQEVSAGVGPAGIEVLDRSLAPERLVDAMEERLRTLEASARPAAPGTSLSPELLGPFFHEFRTSLTMIKTCIALLTNPRISYDPTELREFLDIVRRGGDRIDRLVRDFLTILKLESGVAEREARQVQAPADITGAVTAVAQSLQPDMAERGVTMHLSVDEGLPPLYVLEEHLRTILEKLLHNAVKFSRETGGEVTISVRATEGGVCFEVSDQGIGIPLEEQERIFDRFYQLTRAGLERQGTGLGLAVAKGLAELYGGTIQVRSEVNVGSAFTVVLPASAGSATAPFEEDVPRTAEEAFRRLGMRF